MRALTGRGAAADAGATPRGHAAGRLAPLTGRVLVVEDQPLNREVAIGMLARWDSQLETANDGQQALRRLARDALRRGAHGLRNAGHGRIFRDPGAAAQREVPERACR